MGRPPRCSGHPRHPVRGRATGPGHLEYPVLSTRFKFARRSIDARMAAMIHDTRVLSRTITIYGSFGAVCEAPRHHLTGELLSQAIAAPPGPSIAARSMT